MKKTTKKTAKKKRGTAGANSIVKKLEAIWVSVENLNDGSEDIVVARRAVGAAIDALREWQWKREGHTSPDHDDPLSFL